MDKRFAVVSFANTFTQGIERSIDSFNLSVQPKSIICTYTSLIQSPSQHRIELHFGLGLPPLPTPISFRSFPELGYFSRPSRYVTMSCQARDKYFVLVSFPILSHNVSRGLSIPSIAPFNLNESSTPTLNSSLLP